MHLLVTEGAVLKTRTADVVNRRTHGPQCCIRRRRGHRQVGMALHADLAYFVPRQHARIRRTVRLLLVLFDAATNSVQNDYVINHTQIAHVCVINTHASTGFDPGFDDFARLVHNVTRAFENIAARII